MTGPELLTALRTLGWPLRELARRLGVSENVVRRMARGTRPIEPELAYRLRQAAGTIAGIFPLPRTNDTP